MGAFDWFNKANIPEIDERDKYIDIALDAVRLAVEKTPVDTGRLADSYYIEFFGDLPHQVRVVNDCDYAIYVHEKIENNHPNGGQAKFLEDAGKEIEDSYDVKCYIKLDLEEIALYFDEVEGYAVTDEDAEEKEYYAEREARKLFGDEKSEAEINDIIETFNSYISFNDKSGKLDLYDEKLDFTPLNFDTNSHRFKNDILNKKGVYKVKTLRGSRGDTIENWEGTE